MSEHADTHFLDVDKFEVARSIHRIVRAMHDGECPKCHLLFQSSHTFISSTDGHRCPHCGFSITAAESREAIKLFGVVMERNLEVFQEWRKSLPVQPE